MRRYLVLITILLLPACGFAPTYGTRGENASSPFVTSGLDQIDIALIPDREGQYLRNALIDRFYKNGTPSAPQYLLEIPKVSENVAAFDITIDSEATRRQLKLSATMTLTNVPSGQDQDNMEFQTPGNKDVNQNGSREKPGFRHFF